MKKLITLLSLFFISQTLFGQFAPFRSVSPELSNVSWLASGDINGDGHIDLVSTTYSNGTLSWYENLGGEGFFSQQRATEGENSLRMVELVDFDLDGDLDVLGISRGDNAVVWIENLDGLGSFGEQIEISDNINGGESAYSADFDNDGDLDVVSASRNDNTLALYRRIDGTNDFDDQEIISSTAQNIRCARPLDVDGDNDIDIVATHAGTSEVVIYYNDGFGVFDNQEVLTSSIVSPNLIYIEDFDGDDDIDLVIDGSSDNVIYYLENEGGTFSSPVGISIGGNLVDLTLSVGDIDADGDIDILAAEAFGSDKLYWLSMESDGTFSNAKDIENSITDPKVPVCLDVNGDGRQSPFFVSETGTANGVEKISYKRNLSNSDLQFGSSQLVSIDLSDTRRIVNADMDGDGDLDIVAASRFNDPVVWYENRDALLDFGSPRIIFDAEVSGHLDLAVADIDNDGDNDVILSTHFFPQHRIHWLENLGGGEFSSISNYMTPNSNNAHADIEVVDTDLDGFPDLLYVTASEDKVTIRINDQDGGFVSSNPITNALDFPTLINSGDFNGDGAPDVLVGSFNNDYVELFENIDGNNLWISVSSFSVDDVIDFEAGDLDNDGDLDLVAINDDDLFWYENVDGSEFIQNAAATFVEPFDVSIGDMDGDGYNDIVLGEDSFYGLAWFKNVNGMETFEDVPLEIFYNSQGNYIELGDFDNDGDLDISYLRENSDKIGWIPSTLGDGFTIHGNVFFDENENGIRDNEELTLKNRKLNLQAINLTTWSDEQGDYSFPARIIDYTLTGFSQENWKFTTDSVIQITKDEIVDSLEINFGVTVTNPIKEAKIDVNSAATRCGFEVPFFVDIRNTGTLTIEGFYQVEIDSLTTYISSTSTPDSIVDNTLFWSFDNLNPSFSTGMEIVLLMPDEEFDGEPIHTSGIVTLLDDAGESFYADTTEYDAMITCAIDPNDKLVTPNIANFDNYTLFDELLTYTIRFQNTGSDTAINIVITDYIDPALDLETFEVISSSHNYNVQIDDDRLVSFQFPDIYLPDSSTNQIKSNGFIKYSIRPLDGLGELTEVNNYAEIYFDFNDPIITNTTTNLMVSEYPFMVESTDPLCFGDTTGSIYIDFPIEDLHYAWDNGIEGQALENIPVGEYIVTLTTESGLFAGDTTIIISQPEELEVELFATDETNSNQDGTATAVVDGGVSPYTYLWNTDPVQTTEIAENLAAGDYTVEILDANGCMTSATVTVDQLIGTNQEEIDVNLRISPNPGRENIRVFVSFSKMVAWNVTIYNNLGQIVQNTDPKNGNEGTVQISNDLLPGLYTAQVRFEGNIISKKFIIVGK